MEHTERRRSSRIIALEEKRQQEKERKLALALEKRNNATNHSNNRNRDKGKEKVNVEDQLDDYDEDENHDPTKKGRKSKVPMQDGQYLWNAITAGTYVLPVNGVPEKKLLENVLNYIQRKDSDELFAEPMNPDVGDNYYKVVKEPMDFATMRAKLYEGLYTNIEEFKRDVYLICFNAMTAFPANSRYYKAAEDINSHARRLFEDIGPDLNNFDLELSLNKRRQSRKEGKVGTSKLTRVSPKPAGRNNATHSKAPKTQRKDTYSTPSKESLVSEFLDANKPNIQLNIDPSNYKESLLAFVEDLGPTAKKVAAKKLEALKFQQPLNGDTPIPNLLENVSANQITHQPRPESPIQPNAITNAQMFTLSRPFFNKPLTIPGTEAQQNRNNNTIATGVNIRDGANKGLKIFTNDNRNDDAAPLLSSYYFDNGKGKNQVGYQSSNERGTMDTFGPSKGSMVSQHENIFGNTTQWNTLASEPGTIISSCGLTQVHPTLVISGPQPKPLEFIPGNSLSVPTLTPKRRPKETMPQTRPKETMPGTNLSRTSFMPQRRPKETMPGINLSRPSFTPQRRPKETMPGINLSRPSFMPQIRPEDNMSGIDLSRTSFMPQRRPTETMPGINLSRTSFMPQIRPEDTMPGIDLSGPSFMPQRRPKETIPGINLSRPSFMPQIRPEDTMPGIDLSEPSFMPQIRPKETMPDINLLGPSFIQQTRPREIMPSINLSRSTLSLMSQPRPQDSMSGMNPSNASFWSQLNEGQSIPNKNLSGLTILPSQAAKYSNEPDTSLFNSGTTYQPGDFQALMGSPDLNHSPYPEQVLNQMNPLNPVPLQEPMPSPAPEMPLADAMNCYGEGAAVVGQPEEEASLQLLWDDDEPPGLSLQL